MKGQPMLFTCCLSLVIWAVCFVSVIHTTKCRMKKGDCAAENSSSCSSGCFQIPSGCNEGFDHFGKNKKYQCHCNRIKDCDFSNNGHCKGQPCMFAYSGPNCQKREYHKYIGWNSKSVSTNSSELLWLNHIYRIHQVVLEGNFSETLTEILGSNNQTLQCQSTNDTVVLCTGDIKTDVIEITDNNIDLISIELFGCSPGWFGVDCSQKCHCRNDSECHQLTGVCQGECEKGRHGESCQDINYENIAMGQPAIQSSLEKYNFIFNGKICEMKEIFLNATSVVDGNIYGKICSSTLWEKNPFWSVQLDKYFMISQLRIHTNNKHAFSVYIGDNKTPCFQNNESPTVGIVEVTCREPMVGDNVTIKIETGFGTLSLCEVEVLQCLPGFYGHMCQSRCNMCEQTKCDQFTGSCTLVSHSITQGKNSIIFFSVISVSTLSLVISVILTIKYCQSKRYIKKYLLQPTISTSVSEEILEEETQYIQPIATSLSQQDILIYIQQKKQKLEPFAKDFSDLPCTLIHPCEEAKRPLNRAKNRHQCLLPYDHSRVVLSPDENSSSNYINASFINNKKYISTQVPTAQTMTDFWRMILQEKCSVIVLLTNGEQTNYVQHLPDINTTRNFGSISVQGIFKKYHKHYTVSQYLIYQDNCKPLISWNITQFNFTSWPEGHTPSKPEYFLNFRQKVNSCLYKEHPIVVQSKYGVGSTGTYICLDIFLRKLENNHPLNASYSIRKLYDERCLIFTKREQLEFVYDTIAESMITNDCELQIPYLKEDIERICHKERNVMNSIAEKQFWDVINTVGQHDSEQYDLLEELYGAQQNFSSGNYQIYTIEGYNQDEFILAETPDEKSVNDFWSFVFQHKSFTIITFSDMEDVIPCYLPTSVNQCIHFGHFSFMLFNFEATNLFQCSVLKVSHTQEATTSHTIVNHYEATFWKNKKTLPACQTMQQFAQEILWRNKKNMPMAVHCRDGYRKSGLFCALYSTINMVKTEESCVNIARLWRQMKKDQPEILADKASYIYCLSLIKTIPLTVSHYSEIE